MGGVSDRTFQTIIKKEREEISLMYGESIIKVKFFTIMGGIKIRIKKLFNILN